MAITFNHNDKFYVNGSNVGIGTSTPEWKLQIHENSGGANYIKITNDNTSEDGGNGVLIGISSSEQATFWNYENTNMRFGTNGTTRVTITNIGRFGIGSTAPAAKLNVASTGANAYSSTITKGTNMKGIINALSNNADDMVGIYFGTGTTSEGTHWSGITGSRSQSATDWSTQLNFYTHNEDVANINNATQKMVIKGNGNVGIGTTSPNQKLEIRDTAPFLRITSTLNDDVNYGGREYGGIEWYTEEDYGNAPVVTAYVKSIHTRAGANHSNADAGLVFGTSLISSDATATERMRIESMTGNVGIGTTAPGQKLSINGDVGVMTGGVLYVNDIAAYTGAMTVGPIGSSELKLRTSGTEKMRIQPNGNVGIGTTSPATVLDVVGEGTAIGSTGYYYNARFKDTANVGVLIGHNNTSNGNGMIAGVNKLAFLTYGTDWGERMVIDGDGNVGIGTTSPQHQLNIAGATPTILLQGTGQTLGAGDVLGSLLFYNNDSSTAGGARVTGSLKQVAEDAFGRTSLVFGTSTTDGKAAFGDPGTYTDSTVERMRIDSSGDIGIGTDNPGAFSGTAFSSPILDLSGSFNIRGLSADGNSVLNMGGDTYRKAAIYTSIGTNSPYLAFATSASGNASGTVEAIRIDASQNVGIGTTSPATKLNIDLGSGGTNGVAGLRIGATSNYASLELGTYGAYGGMVRSYGNDLHYFSGHWRTIGNTASENHSHYWYTSKSGSSDWSTVKMELDHNGNLGIGTTGPVTGLDVRTSTYSNTTARFGTTRPVYIVNDDPIIGFNQYYDNGWKSGTTGSSGNIGMNNGGEMYFNVSTASVATDGAVTNRQAIKIFNDANITWGTGGTAAWGEGLLTMNSGWGTNLYPTLGSYDGSTGSLIMLHNPHIPFRTDNAVSASYTGRAGLRMAIDTGGTGFWDAGLAGDFYHIYKSSSGEFLRITNTGNVGIGTTSPGQKLDVSGNVRGNNIYANDSSVPSLYMERGDGNPQAVIRLVKSNDNLLIGNTAIDEVIFYDDAGEAMRLDGAGNLGIGTASPAAKLNIATSSLWGTAVTDAITIDNTGSAGDVNSEHSLGRIRWRTNGVIGASIDAIRDTPGAGHNVDIAFSTNTGGSATSTVERMRINYNGNVGIGTTSPAQKLDVNGDIALKGTSVFNLNSAALTIGDTAGTDSVTTLKLTTAGDSTTVYLDDDGNVGINTATPSYNLTVDSGTNDIGILTASSDSGSYVGFLDNSTSTIPKIGAVGNKLILDASQYVGIKRTDPSYALDVSGTIRATGDVIAYSDARVKENVETIPNALDKVKAMRGVGYNKIGEQKRSIGVIAQEMLEVMPEVVSQDEQGMYSVAYGNLVGVLVEAVKELEAKVEQLENKLNGTAS